MSQELENEKLELEIAELKKAWWKKTDYLRVLLPTTLAIFSLIYAIVSGFFSAKSENLELKKQQLQFEISQFEKEKTNLIKTNEELTLKGTILSDSLKNQNNALQNYKNTLIQERNNIKELNKELVFLKNTRNDFAQEIQTLENEFNEKKEKYLNEIENKYYQEIGSQKEIEKLKKEIQDLKFTIENLSYNIKILKNSPFIKNSQKLEYEIWELEQMNEYYNTKISQDSAHNVNLTNKIEELQKSSDSLDVKMKLLKMN